MSFVPDSGLCLNIYMLGKTRMGRKCSVDSANSAVSWLLILGNGLNLIEGTLGNETGVLKRSRS